MTYSEVANISKQLASKLDEEDLLSVISDIDTDDPEWCFIFLSGFAEN